MSSFIHVQQAVVAAGKKSFPEYVQAFNAAAKKASKKAAALADGSRPQSRNPKP